MRGKTKVVDVGDLLYYLSLIGWLMPGNGHPTPGVDLRLKSWAGHVPGVIPRLWPKVFVGVGLRAVGIALQTAMG
jgi:hypothetical protein